ncbi:hypothetical protein CLV81_0913 [Flagellimonas meridianipacifica]|uniref:Uncharacterized protein n=1 Tax=Flagellimonas meridianipacifica TaxID=1080225 RepID=A0A2T0MH72_9FLAO|nr:hypothetical protein CLV81_0913 [Allomuricauda pacifica]
MHSIKYQKLNYPSMHTESHTQMNDQLFYNLQQTCIQKELDKIQEC